MRAELTKLREQIADLHIRASWEQDNGVEHVLYAMLLQLQRLLDRIPDVN